MRSVATSWPTADELLLLRAAILPDARAAVAFEGWISQNPLDAIGPGCHRLLPAVHANLSRQGLTYPQNGRLAGLRKHAWVHTRQRLKSAAAVVELLEQAGISTLLLKGAALECHYASTPGLRPMSDVDILVRADQAKAGAELLCANGFAPHSPWDEQLLLVRHSSPFKRSTLEIDLHWRPLLQSCSVDEDWAWDTALEAHCEGVRSRVLAPAEQLFHTVVHGVAFSHVSPVRWLVDASTVLERASSIDWDRFVCIAQRHRLCLTSRIALEYLAARLAQPIPDNVLELLQSTAVGVGERLEYVCTTRYSQLLGLMPRHLCHYARLSAGRRLSTRLAGFPDFMRCSWDLPPGARVEREVLSKVAGRVKAWLGAAPARV